MKNIFIILLFFIFTGSGFAQQTLITGGETATGTSGTVSFTIGQPFFHTREGTGGSVSEGVQQPNEILIPIGIEEREMTFTIAPNPASAVVRIINDHHYDGKLSWKIYDVTGKEKESGNITSTETVIMVNNLPKGSYIITIFQNDTRILHHKIIIK